jgi:hypothetical protein
MVIDDFVSTEFARVRESVKIHKRFVVILESFFVARLATEDVINRVWHGGWNGAHYLLLFLFLFLSAFVKSNV